MSRQDESGWKAENRPLPWPPHAKTCARVHVHAHGSPGGYTSMCMCEHMCEHMGVSVCAYVHTYTSVSTHAFVTSGQGLGCSFSWFTFRLS